MNEVHVSKIAAELKLTNKQVRATALLFDEGATIPFIARYRKEVTGSLDEVAIGAIRDRMSKLIELDKRREAILKALEERGQLTDELKIIPPLRGGTKGGCVVGAGFKPAPTLPT